MVKPNKKFILAVEIIAVLILAAIAATYFTNSKSLNASLSLETETPEPEPEPTYLYGIQIDDLIVEEKVIEKNQFLSDILEPYNIEYLTIDALAKKATEVFDVRKLRSGKKYTIISSADSVATAQYFIYDPSPYFYVVYDLRDETNVTKVERPIDIKTKTISGIVFTSMWDAIMDNGMDWEVAVELENIYSWAVDFHHLQEGDRFKMIFEEESIEGTPVGIGTVSAALFEHRGSPNYAFYYEPDETGFGDHYYDEKARPMKKAFLKSPVKYTRISSPFNMRRFHPVLKRVRPHLGTDYAAPHGTPIHAVADGTVTKASYTRGNGRYVKIRHDNIYQTQYLHMSRFAAGIKSGTRVKQGDVIGYVGSTGLATGPHVCFRFWKNGRQVDHRREKLPPPEPMPEKYVAGFNILKDSLKTIVDEMPYIDKEEVAMRWSNQGDSTYVIEGFLP